MRDRVTVSLIWDYFERAPGSYIATCIMCRKEYSFKTTITNLKHHLKRKHLSAYENFKENSRSKREALSPPTTVLIVDNDLQQDDDENYEIEEDYDGGSDYDDDDDHEEATPKTTPRKKSYKRPRHSIKHIQSTSRQPSVVSNPHEDDEFDLFGRTIALQLKKMPLDVAICLQQTIQSAVNEERLKLSRPTNACSSTSNSNIETYTIETLDS